MLLATHSSEIVTEVDPNELILVDKIRRSGRRVTGSRGVDAALEALGSRKALALTRLARSRRVLFVEGDDDFRTMRRFAGRLKLRVLSGTADITDFPLGGHRPSDAPLLLQGIHQALELTVLSGIVSLPRFPGLLASSNHAASPAAVCSPS